MEKVLYYKIVVDGVETQEQEIGKLDIAVKTLTKELNDLHAAEVKDEQAIGRTNVALANAKKQRSELVTEIKKTTVATVAEEGSMVQMEIALQKANLAYRQLSKAKRDSAEGAALLLSIKQQTQEISKLEQATGRFQRQVGNYNTAGVAMSQVLREIPAFTFSAQTGILALSNNIPILVDEMKRISLAIDNVTGKKRGWAGAFKEMASNLFSLGGVMTIALGLFTIFSDKIIEAVTGVNELTEAEKKLIEQQEQTNTTLEKNTNAWRVYNNDLTLSEAALHDLSYTIGVELGKIEKETQEKVKSIDGFWNTLFTNLLYGFGTLGGEYKRTLDKIEEYNNEARKKEEYLNKVRVDANGDAIKIANDYMQKVRELHINEIEDELKRETAKINERRRLALEAAEVPFADDTFTDAAKKRINEAFDLEISQIKIHAENKKKVKVDKLKEELELTGEINKAEIELITDKYIKSLFLEMEDFRQTVENYEKKKKEYPKQEKEINRLIFLAQLEHLQKMKEIQDKAAEDSRKEQSEVRTKKLKGLNDDLDDLEAIRKEHDDTEKANEKKKAAEIKQVKQNLWGSLSEAENLYFKMQEDALERHLRRQIRAIDQDAARQTDILKNRLDKGLISEAQYNADKAELDRQAEAKKQAAEKQAFEKQKKLAKAKIAVDTSVAIVKGYAEMNWVAATIQGVALTGLAALQLAAVDAQEFAEGGLVLDKNKNIPTKPNGDSVLTTLTPGEIVLNKQQQAMLGGNETFARIGVPNVPSIYPNAASGGSMSSVTKKDFQIMFNNLQNGINSKKVYQLESEAKRTRNTVENYETSNKW